MEKDIRNMTVTELGNEIYLLSKRVQAEQSQLSQMERLYAEKYNAEQKSKEVVKDGSDKRKDIK